MTDAILDRMPRPLALLHTAEVHVQTFTRLLAELAPGSEALHTVDCSLLDAARGNGLGHPSVIAAVGDGVRRAAGADAGRFVLCTCSTIGGIAERSGREAGLPVLRVDRPMAARAAREASRVLIVAALESTLAPTLALLAEEARAAGRSPEVVTRLCPSAWPLFEAGRINEYLQAIARAVDRHAEQADMVLLAQASMAPAAALCRTPQPVLSSPRTGLAAALAACGIAVTG